MKYFARITKEGDRVLAEFPDAPGCQTFAEPSEDIQALARDALEGWLEVHLEDGEAPPRPVTDSSRIAGRNVSAVPIRISPALAVRLQLRWARQDADLSQADLAKRVGVSRQQISLLESPKANLRLDTLETVAIALGLQVDVTLTAPQQQARTSSPSTSKRSITRTRRKSKVSRSTRPSR